MRNAYGQARVDERHRHRYEVNNHYREQLQAAGLVFSGTNPDLDLVEFAELPREVHPYYVSTQAHPELRSRPTRPHPLFAGLVGRRAGAAEGRALPDRRDGAAARAGGRLSVPSVSTPREVEQTILDTWDFADPAATAERFRGRRRRSGRRGGVCGAAHPAGPRDRAGRRLRRCKPRAGRGGLGRARRHSARAGPAGDRARTGAELDRRPGRRRAVLLRRPPAGHRGRRRRARDRRVAHAGDRRGCRRRTGRRSRDRRARAGRGRGVRRPAGAPLARVDPQQPRLGPPRLRPPRGGADGLRAGRRGAGRGGRPLRLAGGPLVRRAARCARWAGTTRRWR